MQRVDPYPKQGGCTGGSGGGGQRPNGRKGKKPEKDPNEPPKKGNNKNGAAGTNKCALCRQRKQKCIFDTFNPILPCEACRRGNVECGPKTRASLRVNPGTISPQNVGNGTMQNPVAPARPPHRGHSYSTSAIPNQPPSLLDGSQPPSQPRFQRYNSLSAIVLQLEERHRGESIFSINNRLQAELASMNPQFPPTTSPMPQVSQVRQVPLAAPQQRQLSNTAPGPSRPTSQNNDSPSLSRQPTAGPPNRPRPPNPAPGGLSPTTRSPRNIPPSEQNLWDLDGAETRIANTGVFFQGPGVVWRSSWPAPGLQGHVRPYHNHPPVVPENTAALPDDLFTRENTVATDTASAQQTNNELENHIVQSGDSSPFESDSSSLWRDPTQPRPRRGQ